LFEPIVSVGLGIDIAIADVVENPRMDNIQNETELGRPSNFEKRY